MTSYTSEPTIGMISQATARPTPRVTASSTRVNALPGAAIALGGVSPLAGASASAIVSPRDSARTSRAAPAWSDAQVALSENYLAGVASAALPRFEYRSRILVQYGTT